MTEDHDDIMGLLKAWRWVIICCVLVVAMLCSVSTAAILAVHTSQEAKQQSSLAKQIADNNAKLLADFGKSPFVKVTLDSIQRQGEPAISPNGRGIFVHVCDQLKLVRTAVVSENMQVLIGKAVMGGPGAPMRLPAGSEIFHKGANLMTPVLQVPSNAPRGYFLNYTTYLSDLTRPAPPYQMQAFNFCIVDVGEPLPTHGACPAPPPNPPVPQPNCPAYTTAASG